MCEDDIINEVVQYIYELFRDDHSGHDYWHSSRVYKNAMLIAKTEQCDKFVVALGALLHDADDSKLFKTNNYDNARYILYKCKVDEYLINNIIEAIKTVSFKGTDTITSTTIEGKIIQDADRLDAIGAIGIARAFTFGGSHGRDIYDPKVNPEIGMSGNEYKKHKGTTVNHFYEKLFQLKDLMNTEAAKKIAVQRDEFMHQYIDEFFNEWNL